MRCEGKGQLLRIWVKNEAFSCLGWSRRRAPPNTILRDGGNRHLAVIVT